MYHFPFLTRCLSFSTHSRNSKASTFVSFNFCKFNCIFKCTSAAAAASFASVATNDKQKMFFLSERRTNWKHRFHFVHLLACWLTMTMTTQRLVQLAPKARQQKQNNWSKSRSINSIERRTTKNKKQASRRRRRNPLDKIAAAGGAHLRPVVGAFIGLVGWLPQERRRRRRRRDKQTTIRAIVSP